MSKTYLFNSQKLAEIVRSKRGSKPLREIQDITSVSASTLSRIENRKIAPCVETLAALCSWLEIEPGDLFEFEKPQPQETKTPKMKILQIMPADGWMADYLYQGGTNEEYTPGEKYSFPLIGFALVEWSEIEVLQIDVETNPNMHGLVTSGWNIVPAECINQDVWQFIGFSKQK